MLAGVIGVPLGSFMAQRYRPLMPNCDPLICALGLFISSPMVYFGMILADVSLGWTLFFVFLAEVSLNLTWSLVADILLVRRRSNWRDGHEWRVSPFFSHITNQSFFPFKRLLYDFKGSPSILASLQCSQE